MNEKILMLNLQELLELDEVLGHYEREFRESGAAYSRFPLISSAMRCKVLRVTRIRRKVAAAMADNYPEKGDAKND